MFERTNSTWTQTQKLVSPDAKAEDRFGWNVALSNNTAIIAVPHRDDNGSASGAAYVVDLQH
ncbi:FG-GAP repeat protein [Rheinheimera sp.]|uniref:FG-GAP repeat protein n=1 Tax=Rheinheimera sp. TaxID=1869214 RepID=UPI004047804D